MPGGFASRRGAVAPCGRNPQNKDWRTTNLEDDPGKQGWEPGESWAVAACGPRGWGAALPARRYVARRPGSPTLGSRPKSRTRPLRRQDPPIGSWPDLYGLRVRGLATLDSCLTTVLSRPNRGRTARRRGNTGKAAGQAVAVAAKRQWFKMWREAPPGTPLDSIAPRNAVAGAVRHSALSQHPTPKSFQPAPVLIWLGLRSFYLWRKRRAQASTWLSARCFRVGFRLLPAEGRPPSPRPWSRARDPLCFARPSSDFVAPVGFRLNLDALSISFLEWKFWRYAPRRAGFAVGLASRTTNAKKQALAGLTNAGPS